MLHLADLGPQLYRRLVRGLGQRVEKFRQVIDGPDAQSPGRIIEQPLFDLVLARFLEVMTFTGPKRNSPLLTNLGVTEV